MVKTGYRLFATRVYDSTFRKQAKSRSHFVRLCVSEEQSKGYNPPRKFWHLYEPDFEWDPGARVWIDRDGKSRAALPPGF